MLAMLHANFRVNLVETGERCAKLEFAQEIHPVPHLPLLHHLHPHHLVVPFVEMVTFAAQNKASASLVVIQTTEPACNHVKLHKRNDADGNACCVQKRATVNEVGHCTNVDNYAVCQAMGDQNAFLYLKTLG